MTLADLQDRLPWADVGRELHALCAELFPICRSITGDGVRATLARVGQDLPLEVHEVPTGTPVFDWTVPPEWNVRDAWVKDPAGNRVVDFRRCNLHVVGYSVPVSARLPLRELREHVHTLPDRPSLVPYRTSYYSESWGFCMSEEALAALPEGEYEVGIDATLAPGSLTYGECLIPGRVDDEVLLTAHVCHPSLANDNLSGIALLAFLGAQLRAAGPLRLSYRLLLIPGTIGSITWLARNEHRVGRIRHGLVLSGAGDPGPCTYKRSRRGDAEVDRAAAHVLAGSGDAYQVEDFTPYGYDERQFCSPGFDLPVGRFGRTPHGRYPEYHTSGDDLDFVRPEHLADSARKLLAILDVLERDARYRNLNPKCEPQLGRRGLYRAVGGTVDSGSVELALLWVLNLSDGRHSLLDVAERSGLVFTAVRSAADALLEAGLLAPVDDGPVTRGVTAG